MDHTDDTELPELRHERRVTVPISFTGDIAGFLFDLLSDIEAIVWEADADTLTVEFVNDRVLDLLGYEPMDVVAVPGFWASTIVHPDDREAFIASQEDVIRRGVSRITYRALSTEGTVVWLSLVAHLTIDQEGRRRVRGLETDVTAMKRAEAAARESEQRFRLLSDASRDSVIVHSGGVIVEVNQAFCEQFGWSPDEALELRPADYIAPESLGLVTCRLEGGGGGEAFEVVGLHRGGEHRWYSAQSREARFHGREAQVVVLTDITDLRQREQRALHDAMHDQLTGLPNRAGFERRLHEELERRQDGQLLGILFCDLNGFKAVNDTLGHNAGDLLLRLVAERLRQVVRTSDPVFRLGGDEFVILLPGLGSGADRVVDETRRRLIGVFDAPFPLDGATANVGTAVGTAICPTHGATADQLVEHADMAMYVHKRATKAAA